MRKLGLVSILLCLIGAFVLGFIYNPLGKAQSKNPPETAASTQEQILPLDGSFLKESENKSSLTGEPSLVSRVEEVTTGSFMIGGGINSDPATNDPVPQCRAEDLEALLRLAKEEAAALLKSKEEGSVIIGAAPIK